MNFETAYNQIYFKDINSCYTHLLGIHTNSILLLLIKKLFKSILMKESKNELLWEKTTNLLSTNIYSTLFVFFHQSKM